MYKCSENLDQFMPAFLKAQMEMDKVVKNSSNPHFKSRYADINAVLDVALPALNHNGIALEQPPVDFSEGCLEVAMVLTHVASCQYKMYSCKSPVAKSDPQGIGSAETYLRRYLMVGVLALGAEDDDGNRSSYPPDDKKSEQYSGHKIMNGRRSGKAEPAKIVRSDIKGTCIIGRTGRLIPLTSLPAEKLQQLLEIPEYEEIWDEARGLLESIDDIETKMDELAAN